MSPGRDSITVLRSAGPLLAKSWTAEGIEAYGSAWQYRSSEHSVGSIAELYALLQKLERDPRACIIRGRYVGDEAAAPILVGVRDKRISDGKDATLKPGHVPRVGELFVDQPLHTLMIDVDDWRPEITDPVLQPEKAAFEFITTVLPGCFHDITFAWQLSGSAGAEKNAGVLKMHLWFFLKTPYNSAQLRAWAATVPSIDVGVFNPVQVHYTASPRFADGIVDPVPVRSGLSPSFLDLHAVDLLIPAEVLASERKDRARQRAMEDPRDKPGLIGAFCRAFEPSELADMLPDMFDSGRDERHFNWIGHDTGSGIYITDDGQHLVSVHNTAPTGQNRAANTFDFARLHLFEGLDAETSAEVRMGERPSYLAMRDWIAACYPHVLDDIQHEGSTPEDDFAGLDDEVWEVSDGGCGVSEARAVATIVNTTAEATGGAPAALVKPPQATKAGPAPLKVWRPSELRDRPAARWRVQGWIPERGTGVLFGDSNVGKSFVALDLALSIARGVDWHGHRVIEGAAVYVAAEGGHGFGRRLDAYAVHHEIKLDDVPFGLVDEGLDLRTNEVDVARVIKACSKFSDETGEPVALVVLDTLARMIVGGNENSPEDMGKVIAAASKIAAVDGCLRDAGSPPGQERCPGCAWALQPARRG